MIWRDNPSARRPWRARITIQGKKTQRSFGTKREAQDVPLEWISRQLGHTSLEVTLRHYARFLKAYDIRQVEKLDALEPPADESRK